MLVGEHGATLRANRVGTTTVDVGSLVQLWSYKIRLAWHRMNRWTFHRRIQSLNGELGYSPVECELYHHPPVQHCVSYYVLFETDLLQLPDIISSIIQYFLYLLNSSNCWMTSYEGSPEISWRFFFYRHSNILLRKLTNRTWYPKNLGFERTNEFDTRRQYRWR